MDRLTLRRPDDWHLHLRDGSALASVVADSARRKALETLDVPWPVVIYEAPHRIADTLQALAEKFGDSRELLIARELTKKFEEVARMKLGDAAGWLEAGPHRQQGEFVLVLGPGAAKAAEGPDPLRRRSRPDRSRRRRRLRSP